MAINITLTPKEKDNLRDEIIRLEAELKRKKKMWRLARVRFNNAVYSK